MKLYPYQRRDAKRLRASLDDGKRTLYVLPTGGGKTVVAVSLILAELRRGGGVLFLAHRRELIFQAVARLHAAGLAKKHIGVIMAGQPETPDAAVQVAAVQTLTNRERPEATLIIVDEAHRTEASTYKKILGWYSRDDASVLGLTATPCRMSGGLGDSYDRMIEGPKHAELIALGRVAAPSVLTPPDDLLPELERVKKARGDYAPGELERAVNIPKLVGAVYDHWARHANEQPTVLYASGVAHAKAFRDDLHAHGVATEHIDGTTPTDEREAILARLRSGDTKVVTNCDVLTEGWDFADLGCVILARPTCSLRLYLQMCGRLRATAKVPLILDHAGNALMRFGRPDLDREWSLDSGEVEKSTRKLVRVCRRCEACGETIDRFSGVCLRCNAEQDIIEFIDGELVEAAGGARQEFCAGYGATEGQCRNRPHGQAFQRWAVRDRNGEPWRCMRCARRRTHQRKELFAEVQQEFCVGFGEVEGRCRKRPGPTAFSARNQAKRQRRHGASSWMCSSCAIRKSYGEDPGRSAECGERLRKLLQNPERKAKLSESLRKRHQDPAFKAKLSESLRKRHQDPAFKAKMAKRAREQWEDPEYKAKHVARLRERHKGPEYKAKNAERMRKVSTDPDNRAKSVRALRERWEDPDYKAKTSAELRARQQDPEYRARNLANLRVARWGKKKSIEPVESDGPDGESANVAR